MGMCLSASALVTAKVFIIELGSDKRVLVWISCFSMCPWFMRLSGRCPEGRWRERTL